MIFRYAVIRLPGFNARVVDLGAGLTENEAWTAARARCTPSERVEGIHSTRTKAQEAL